MRVRRYLAAGAAAALLTVGAVAVAPVAQAGLPTTVDPNIPDGDADSLRDVLENQITGGETVVLEAGATYTLDNCGEGDIDIAAAVTIEGNGATIEQTCEDRVLSSGSDLTITDLTITGGRVNSSGAGIDFGDEGSAATLMLVGVLITGNEAGGDGGAIDTSGDTTVIDSVLSGNKAGEDGGAIDESDGGVTIHVERSTIAGNCAESDGGAISTQDDDTVTLVNSTVTGNTSDDSGALEVARNDTTLTLVYTDVVDNTLTPDVDCGITVDSDATATEDPESEGVGALAVDGANVDLVDEEDFGTMLAFGSVIALPNGGENCGTDGATVTSSGYNFSDDASCDLTGTTDKQSAGDPLLGALADNGGPTPTLLPQTGSPLINAIPLAACGGGDTLAGDAVTTDQRGVTRPQETGCEIGSVEIEAPVPPVIEPTFTG